MFFALTWSVPMCTTASAAVLDNLLCSAGSQAKCAALDDAAGDGDDES